MARHRKRKPKLIRYGLALAVLLGGIAFSADKVTGIATQDVAVTASAPPAYHVTIRLPEPQKHSQPHVKPVLTYTVRTGDSLWSVAAAHCGSGTGWSRLSTANHLADPGQIYPGEVLVLACR